MDFKKYSRYLDQALTALLDDLEKSVGKEVDELPPKQTVLVGSRFLLKGDTTQEYIKLSDGEYHLLGGGGTADIDVSFQKTATHIQYSVNGGDTWVDLVALSEITGDAGADGSDGLDGDSAYVYIAYASDDSGTGFTTTFNSLLDYIAILATDTEIASPQASDFTGLWKNYKGEAGTDAKNIELRIDSGYVQWRYIGESWTNLIAVTEITGDNGQNIDHVSFTSTTGTGQGEAGETDTYTVWGDAGETINLGTFTVYNGEDGTAGVGVPSGGTAGQVLKKIDATDYNTEWADESGGGASALDDLTDVNAPSPTDGQVLKYDSGTSKWIPGLAATSLEWVDFVSASTCNYETSSTTISVTLPADIQADDLILLVIMHRDTLSSISGYTLEISEVNLGSSNQSLSIYKKTAVVGDASAVINLTQNSSQRFAVQALVFRSRTGNTLEVQNSDGATVSTDTETESPEILTNNIGDMAVIASTFTYSQVNGSTTISFPSGYINTTEETLEQNRLAVAYRNAVFFAGVSGGVIISTDTQETYSIHVSLVIGHT